MSNRKGGLVGFMVGLVVVGASLSAYASGDAPISTVQRAPVTPIVQLSLGTSIAISCSNPGSHQDVSKQPILKNTAGATIKKGTLLTWKATDGDSGSVKLEADLPPNGTVTAMGSAGNGYQCTAGFFSKPDLAIKTAQWATQTSINVQVQNLDGFVDAKPSIVHLEVYSCSNQLLASADSPLVAIGKGETKTLAMAVPATSGKRYLKVKADSTMLVSEKNEANNVMDTMDSCVY